MIQIKAFNKAKDFKLFTEWRDCRSLSTIPAEALPDTGLMAYCDDKPVGCAFLVLTNTPYCFMETICIDPMTDETLRYDIIQELTDGIALLAKNLGFKRLVGFAHHKGLIGKGIAAGWIVDQNVFRCFTKELT